MEQAILARHGESEVLLAGLVSGDPAEPSGLTEAGRQQARRLCELVAGEPIDLCVTSEFARTRETADLALEGRDVPRLVVPELNDIRYGQFEGRPFDDYLAWAGAFSPTDVCPGGGESRADVAARYVRGYLLVLARPERTILVVTHGLAIGYVLLALEELDPTPIVDQVGLAEPHRLTRDELERAVARLERWAAAPAWPA